MWIRLSTSQRRFELLLWFLVFKGLVSYRHVTFICEVEECKRVVSGCFSRTLVPVFVWARKTTVCRKVYKVNGLVLLTH